MNFLQGSVVSSINSNLKLEIMNANEMSNNVVNEAIQCENKFFPEFIPIELVFQVSPAVELEKLVRMCGSNAILY